MVDATPAWVLVLALKGHPHPVVPAVTQPGIVVPALAAAGPALLALAGGGAYFGVATDRSKKQAKLMNSKGLTAPAASKAVDRWITAWTWVFGIAWVSGVIVSCLAFVGALGSL